MKKKIKIFLTIISIFIAMFFSIFLLASCSEKEIYTVNFDSCGGTYVPSQHVENGKKATKPDNPTKYGYTFDDWYYQDEKWSFIGYTVTEDITLVAKWIINKTVSLINNISDMAEVTGLGYYGHGDDAKIKVTPYLGYQFNGAYIDDLLVSSEESFFIRNIDKDYAIYIDISVAPQFANFDFNSDKTTLKINGIKDKTVNKIVVPDVTTEIKKGAFAGCSNLKSITLPFIGESKATNNYLGYLFGASSYENNSSYVPSMLKTVKVLDASTKIGDGAFYGCSSLTSITIPNGVITKIGDGAFYGCSSLTRIIIPTFVTNTSIANFEPYIGDGAFYGCSSLTSITIPNGLIKIYSDAFYGCKSLQSITIPKGVRSIGNGAFYGCSSLTSITIPNGVTDIGHDAFYGCSSLTSIAIPNGVTNIYYGAFYGCSSLTSIIIPDGVTSIDSDTFYGCKSLQSITIPNGVRYMGDDSFYGCSSLTNITIPNSVTSIGDGAFFGCSSLTNITIPNHVTSISDDAFHGCSSLTSIIIPNGVTNIYHGAFYGCSSLTSITIPNHVKSIDSSAFYGCSSLTSITIPNSVTSIGNNAFCDCSSLTSIIIPNSVTNIYYSAFHGCSSLTNITIPNSVTSISNGAFWDCSSLTSITIPNSVTSIGNNAFHDCSALTSIIIPSSVTNIRYNAFNGCKSLQSITIPNSVKSIENNAFRDCSSLVNITIGNSVTSIYQYAFYNCSSLENVYYNGTISNWCNISISNYDLNPMFYASNFYILDENGDIEYNGNKYSLLTELVIPNTVTSIGKYQFYNFSKLTSIVISNGVTSIGQYAFSECINLTSIEIPNSVTSIGQYAFYNCISLANVTVPNSVTSIGNRAFFGCFKLVEIYNLSSLDIQIESTDNGFVGYYAKIIHTSLSDESVITKDDNGYVFAYIDDKGYLIGYEGNDTELVLPNSFIYNGNTINNYEINKYAFYNCSNLISVEISNSVTNIGSGAFYGCKIQKVYYLGTEEEWNLIRINSFNSELTSATRYYYSEEEPQDSGNYWHYVDGVATVWL